MKKHPYSIVSMLLWFMLISGCATMQDRWSLVVNQNTRSNYENFIKEYPDSEMAKEAKKRLEDPDYAFMTTCQIGTKEAFEGFVNSYPASNYVPTAKAYIEFLKETRSGDIKSYKRFIAQYPNNIFVTDAKISVPLLWLKEKGNKVGVAVNIKELIYKGIFGGGYGSVEGARQKIWQAIKKELDQEGIQAVLLNSLESSKEEGIKEVVIADYSESYTERTPSYTSYTSTSINNDDYKNTGAAGAMAMYSAQSLGNATGQILSSIFYDPGIKVISITVKGVKDGVEYYSGFPTLSSSVGNINMGEAIRAICDNPNPMLTIAELKGRNLSDPLIASALRGDTDSVRRLLDKGANVNVKDVHSNTALNWASAKGHIDIVKILLTKGVDVNAKNNNGDIALMSAAASGYTKIVELLLAQDAEVNAKNDNGKTSLFFAAQNGHTEIVEALLNKGADVNVKNNDGDTALMLAAKNGYNEIAQTLLDRGVEVNAKGNDGRTALIYAVQSSHHKIVEILLDKGADVNAREVNYGYTALMSAAAKGDIEITEALLAKGANLDAKDNYNSTVLMSAAQNGHTKIVEILLSKGADVNAKDKCGQTALFLAAQNGHSETIRLLKQARIKK